MMDPFVKGTTSVYYLRQISQLLAEELKQQCTCEFIGIAHCRGCQPRRARSQLLARQHMQQGTACLDNSICSRAFHHGQSGSQRSLTQLRSLLLELTTNCRQAAG